MTPLYNYKTKKFDAAQVDAVAYENGVAVLSEYGAAKTYIVDTSFKVGFDLSNKPFTMNDLGLKLKNNRFLIEDHIVDAKLNVIASIPEAEYVYKDSQLITFQYNEYFGAVDFDGKVVLEPKYENLELAGGIAFTDVRKSVAETTPDCLVSVTNPAGTSTDKLLGDSENWLSAPLPGLLVKKNNDTDTVTLYNYAETVLATLSGVSSLHHSGTSSEHNVITFYSSTDNAYVSYLLA